MRKWKIKIEAVLEDEEFDTWYGADLISDALVERFGWDLDAEIEQIKDEK